MKPEITMYTTLWTTFLAGIVIAGWFLMTDFEQQNIDTAKQELLALETGYSSGWEFINTEWANAPEIIVDQDLIDQMPVVEEELDKEEIEEKNVEETQELPKEVNLDVTFYPQAPDWDWSLPWKEACEESSVIQAYYYVTGKNLDKETFKSEVLSIVDLQNNLFNKYIDTSVEETAIFLEEHFGYTDYEIIENPTIEQLKTELAQWHPIVAPFAWKELGNGFFTNWGPRYHMLTIVWYNEEFFLTNDVGTSRWENFAYSYETIMNAMHDLVPLWEWDILTGEKRVLVIK